jgi:hypothetical protein
VRAWHHLVKILPLLLFVVLQLGCSSTPAISTAQTEGKIVCDSYIVLDMCVRDLVGDGTVDMVYFSDSREIFMYQQGRQDVVNQVMPLHRCAVPLNMGMQATTNRILERENLSLTEELDITRKLIANYAAARPEINACNARFEDQQAGGMAQEDEFFVEDSGWDDE